jgi:hypothetical protein
VTQILALNIEPAFILILAVLFHSKFRVNAWIMGCLALALAGATYHLYVTTLEFQSAGNAKGMTVDGFMTYVDRVKWLIVVNKVIAYGLICYTVFRLKSGYARCA